MGPVQLIMMGSSIGCARRTPITVAKSAGCDRCWVQVLCRARDRLDPLQTWEIQPIGAVLKRRNRREHESLSGVGVYRPCCFMFTSALRPMETQKTGGDNRTARIKQTIRK